MRHTRSSSYMQPLERLGYSNFNPYSILWYTTSDRSMASLNWNHQHCIYYNWSTHMKGLQVCTTHRREPVQDLGVQVLIRQHANLRLPQLEVRKHISHTVPSRNVLSTMPPHLGALSQVFSSGLLGARICLGQIWHIRIFRSHIFLFVRISTDLVSRGWCCAVPTVWWRDQGDSGDQSNEFRCSGLVAKWW